MSLPHLKHEAEGAFLFLLGGSGPPLRVANTSPFYKDSIKNQNIRKRLEN